MRRGKGVGMFILHDPLEKVCIKLLSTPSSACTVYITYSDERYSDVIPRGANAHIFLTDTTRTSLLEGPPARGTRRHAFSMVFHNPNEEDITFSMSFTGILYALRDTTGSPTETTSQEGEFTILQRKVPGRSSFAYGNGGWETIPEDVAASSPGSTLVFGCGNINNSADTRYLYPGFSQANASITSVAMVAPRKGTIKNFYVRHNSNGGTGPVGEYRLRVGGLDTLMVASLATGIVGNVAGPDIEVPVEEGNLIEVSVLKPIAPGNGVQNAVVSMQYLN
jgi:hypothetical protein